MTLAGNRATEAAALAWVMDLERKAGREPVDNRHVRAFAGDILSPPRTIELKTTAKSFRGWFLWLEPVQLEAALHDPEFYIYVVENIAQGDPAAFTLKVLHGDLLRRLAGRAREKRYFEMPWPVADYDAALGKEGL